MLLRLQRSHGVESADRLRAWQELLEVAPGGPPLEILRTVNDFFNELEFSADLGLWGIEDYWATPLEFLVRGAGDCEDFSVAKYFTLKALGFADSAIYLTYVKSRSLDQAHMVVTYYPDPTAEPLVLDNLVASILPASARDDLVPVFSFNGEGLWVAKQRRRGDQVGGADRLVDWRDLLLRMEADGTSALR